MKDQAGMAKGAQMAQMGKTLATIGKAAVGMAAVAGVVLVLIKLFMDLEKKIKDMNKAIMDGAGSADFGLTPLEIQSGKLGERLTLIRQETTAVNKNFMRFRAVAAEQQKILATFNQAGITYGKMNEEIQKGSKFMQSYSDVTALALTYSRNLGMESTKIAQDMGTMADVTGQSLEEVAKSFSIIQREATVSGFMTKRFYSAVVEATTGMAFYGVRITETTDLLKSFDSLLGEAAGTEVFRKIAREGGKSYQESLKEFLVKDPEFAKKQYQTVYRQRLADLEREMKGALPEGMTIEKLLEETGGGPELAKRLTGMGVSGQQRTNIMQIDDLRRASEGNMAAMMAARGAAGPAFEAVMKLRTMGGLGGESLAEVREKAVKEENAGLLVAMQQLAESQGKDLDEFVELDRANTANFAHLQDVAAGQAEMTEELSKLGFFIKDGEIMRGVAKELADGTIDVQKEGAVKIGDKFDLLLTRPTEDGKMLEEQLTKDQEIATRISENVTGLSEILEQTTNAILERIYDAIMVIVDLISPNENKKRRDAGTKGAKDREKKAEERAEEQQRKLEEAEENLAEAIRTGDASRIKEAQDAVDAARGQKEAADEGVVQAKATRAAIENMSDETRKGMAMGFSDIVAKQRDAGMDVLGGPGAAKGLASEVERSLTRADTKFSVFDPSSWSLGNYSDEAFSELTAAMVGTLGVGSLSARTRENLTASDAVSGNVREGAIDEAIKAGEAAFAEAGGGFLATRNTNQAAIEAYNTAVSHTLAANLLSEEEQRKQHEENQKKYDDMIKALEEGGSGAATSVVDYIFGRADRPKDLILPADGSNPIMTDERDTLIATRPGGPIDRVASGGRGGGGGGAYNFYFTGSPNENAKQVMKILKDLDLA